MLKGEDTRSVHRAQGGGESVVRLLYEEGNVSSSMSSSSSQTMSTITDSGVSPSTAQDSGQEGSLADQIQKQVSEIIEEAMP